MKKIINLSIILLIFSFTSCGIYKKTDARKVSPDVAERVKDNIINPAHYKVIPAGNYPEGLEYMDLMNYILAHHKGIESHLVGQILKYSIRLGKKDAKQQDALKIQWYANYLVEVIKKQDER